MLENQETSEMRAIYVPIFDRFFESSIMYEDLPTRFVMLALIRLAYRAGADGIVDMDPRLFAQSINLPLEDVNRAIQRLMEPDPSSHSPDENGRRIIPVDPSRPFRGWKLVNWEKYRVLVNRINDAARKRDEYHAKKDTPVSSESLHEPPAVSNNLRPSPVFAEISLRDDTRRDDTIRDESKRERERFAPPTLDEVSAYIAAKGYTFKAEAFMAYYETRGWKLGKTAMRSWKAACLTWQQREANGSSSSDGYPPEATVIAFKKSMFGLNQSEYNERFRQKFGVEPKPESK